MKKLSNFIVLVLIFIMLLSSFQVASAASISTLLKSLKKSTTLTTNNTTNSTKTTSVVDDAPQKTTVNASFNNEMTLKLAKKAMKGDKELTLTNLGGYEFIQGTCTDGTYIYVATVSKTGNVAPYSLQKTKLLIFKMSTMEHVRTVDLGKIGHSNCLAYNPNKKIILIATQNTSMCWIYSAKTSDLLNGTKSLTKIKTKDKKGKTITNFNFSTVAYNEARDEYLLNSGNDKIGVYDSNFKMKRFIRLNTAIRPSDTIGQITFCDSSYIYCLYNKKSSGKYINYIKVYTYNGEVVKNYNYTIEVELESMFAYKGNYYLMGNLTTGKLPRVYKFNLRNSNYFELSFVSDIRENEDATKDNKTTRYQSAEYNGKTTLMKTGFKNAGKTLKGYKAYRDCDGKWRVNVDGKAEWATIDKIKEYKNAGKKVTYVVYKTTAEVISTTKAGTSAVMTAIWE